MNDSGFTDVEKGQLIQNLKQLNENVEKLNDRLDQHDRVLNTGKGVMIAVLLIFGTLWTTVQGFFGE